MFKKIHDWIIENPYPSVLIAWLIGLMREIGFFLALLGLGILLIIESNKKAPEPKKESDKQRRPITVR